jgi:hypothetical protein
MATSWFCVEGDRFGFGIAISSTARDNKAATDGEHRQQQLFKLFQECSIPALRSCHDARQQLVPSCYHGMQKVLLIQKNSTLLKPPRF